MTELCKNCGNVRKQHDYPSNAIQVIETIENGILREIKVLKNKIKKKDSMSGSITSTSRACDRLIDYISKMTAY